MHMNLIYLQVIKVKDLKFIIVFIVVLACSFTYLYQSSYAKYRKRVTADVGLTVAKWTIKINNEEKVKDIIIDLNPKGADVTFSLVVEYKVFELPKFDVVIAIWEDKNEIPPLYVEVTVSERED